MGRMLETLKLGEGRRAPLAMSKPADAAPAQDCVVDWEIGAEVPFVEVGGPNKKVELSPGLMQHPPQVVPQAPHLPVEKTSAPSAVVLTEAKPMTAAFEPWPAPTPTLIGISKEVIVYHQPDHAASKEYAVLLETMSRGLKADSANVLLLTGMKPHVGTSTVLLNLAACAAMKQKSRIVLMDANRCHPSLAQRLGQGASVGLLEVLGGTLALEHAIVKTGIPSLHLLPAGSASKKPSAFCSEALAWLITWMRTRYDLILIAGPTLDDADLAVQVPHADGIYLVLPQGESPLIGKGAAQSISRMGGRLCGLIHTHFDV